MSAGNAERNLLVGMLALQMSLINQPQLIMGLQAWMQDKSKGIEDILVQQKAISAEEREFLRSVVQKYSQLQGGDLTRGLAEISNASSVEEKIGALDDESLYRTLQSVQDRRRKQADPEQTTSYSSRERDAESRRFRILRPHARGGLGQVSVAEDLELHREVALKEMQPQFWTDANSRQRFMMEAEITGRLEHPGIVPVYSMGNTEQGKPFYVMRFIHGNSLKEEINDLYDAKRPDLADDAYRLALRKLLRRFVDVCNAVEYAHSRGCCIAI